jgi:hypothetical protein
MNWQPIETAPRDGTPILAYQPNVDKFGIEKFYYETMAVVEYTSYGWCISGVNGWEWESDIKSEEITHWAPIEPPK